MNSTSESPSDCCGPWSPQAWCADAGWISSMSNINHRKIWGKYGENPLSMETSSSWDNHRNHRARWMFNCHIWPAGLSSLGVLRCQRVALLFFSGLMEVKGQKSAEKNPGQKNCKKPCWLPARATSSKIIRVNCHWPPLPHASIVAMTFSCNRMRYMFSNADQSVPSGHRRLHCSN